VSNREEKGERIETQRERETASSPVFDTSERRFLKMPTLREHTRNKAGASPFNDFILSRPRELKISNRPSGCALARSLLRAAIYREREILLGRCTQDVINIS